MKARLSALLFLCCVTAVAAPVVAPLRIGQSLKELRAAAGSASIQAGGPQSKGFLHFEVTGALAERVTGQVDGTVYVVFKAAQDSEASGLVYASWRLKPEHEPALLRQFGIASAVEGRPQGATCTRALESGKLAVAEDTTSWLRQAVLEATEPPNQARPSFSDLCGAARLSTVQ